jgi:sucrose-6-phosphate hydrolase SacC (GH32 family)
VLVISLNPGGVAGGSGTQYVVGSFDGVVFTPDAAPIGDPVEWLDFGRDCYAGVTFDNLRREERTLVAWMSNWDYARELHEASGALAHPSMTVPRRLSLVRTADGRVRLRQVPVLASTPGRDLATGVAVAAELDLGTLPDAARITVRVECGSTEGFALGFGDHDGNEVVLRYDRAARVLTLDRRAGGDRVAADFGSVERMPVAGGPRIDLDIVLDRASIEIFADAGCRVLTDLIVPAVRHRTLSVQGLGGEITVEAISVADLSAAGELAG